MDVYNKSGKIVKNGINDYHRQHCFGHKFVMVRRIANIFNNIIQISKHSYLLRMFYCCENNTFNSSHNLILNNQNLEIRDKTIDLSFCSLACKVLYTIYIW